ncbi:MAG: Unknown protein [uncultured Sulfurovum sp.]|uniref:Uncharacterized protein n=1 Tax=uncultured Sulfurovum sp. TaxID=269237 RepID=A0A6S6TQK2_9BACT|nr:MAG: Unknown protein [uncultured Sulfurovum sp.]
MKKIILITATILTHHILYADVMNKTYKPYKPMYSYSYSYSRLINLNNYSLKYLEMKKEHKKVVRLLENANKTISDLEFRIQALEKNSNYWKNKANKRMTPNAKAKREEALKKMREQLKVK